MFVCEMCSIFGIPAASRVDLFTADGDSLFSGTARQLENIEFSDCTVDLDRTIISNDIYQLYLVEGD